MPCSTSSTRPKCWTVSRRGMCCSWKGGRRSTSAAASSPICAAKACGSAVESVALERQSMDVAAPPATPDSWCRRRAGRRAHRAVARHFARRNPRGPGAAGDALNRFLLAHPDHVLHPPDRPGGRPQLLALSERTGTASPRSPANRERLASRIERALASFAGNASVDACYMFVLVAGASRGADARDPRVVGISAIEAAVGPKEPCYNYHVGTLVHASRALNVYTVAPTLFLANDHTGHTELCSLFLDQALGKARTACCWRRAGCCSSRSSRSSSHRRSSPNCADD